PLRATSVTALRAPAWSPDGPPTPSPGKATAPVPRPAPEGDAGEAPRVLPMDGFRALAILWIFLLHAWVDSGRAPMDHGIFRMFFSEGYLGLDILFILS